MDPTLFSLISRAGKASLDELRARSRVDQSVLARELVTMWQEGVVALSCEPGVSDQDKLSIQKKFGNLDLDTSTISLLYCIPDREDRIKVLTGDEAKEAMRKARAREIMSKAMTLAFNDDRAAECVMVSPTTRGFKMIL